MSILRVLIFALLPVSALFLWRMIRRDDGVQGLIGLCVLLFSGVLAAVEGVVTTAG